VERFRGMFAFAIWDRVRQRLFCARDRLGIKPFYYYHDGQNFVFASEIKALLEHPRISARLEEAVLPEILAFGYSNDDRTMFAGIRRLMPGHILVADWRDGRVEIRTRAYWDIPAPASEPVRSDQEWTRELRRRLEETVEMRLMADVPLGTFLSGGVDSSAITALVKQLAGGRVKTFSVGYAETEYSELSYAAELAAQWQTDHHEVRLGARDFFEALPKLIWHEDEPLAWPSSVSLYFVSKLAAQEVKVVLTGEGSDELFGGYERYWWTQWNQRGSAVYEKTVPGWVRGWVRDGLARPGGSRWQQKLGHTFLGRTGDFGSLYLDNFYSAFSQDEQRRLRPGSADNLYDNYLRHWERHPQASALRRMLYVDQKTYLAELLMKQDQMSMAASIESRVPLLDHTFVEFAMRIPDHLKIRGRQQKYIFKKAVEDLVPASILHRRKMGFPTPIRDWLRDPGLEPIWNAMTERGGFLRELLDGATVEQLIAAHRGGGVATDRLWRLMNLQIWGDLFITGRKERWSEGLWREPAAVAQR
jgi:asparagine synthase (glutamine-hydrolysing)